MRNLERHLFLLVLFGSVMQMVPLFGFMGLDLKLGHFSVLGALCLSCFSNFKHLPLLLNSPIVTLFLGSLLIWVTTITVFSIRSVDPMLAISFLLREILSYMLIVSSLYISFSYFRKYGMNMLAKDAIIAGISSIVLVIVYCFANGFNPITPLIDFAKTGNYSNLQFSLYYKLFSLFDPTNSSAARHGTMFAFLTLSAFCLVGSRVFEKRTRHFDIFCFYLFLLIVLSSFSRQVIVVLLIFIGSYFFRRIQSIRSTFVGFTVFFVFCMSFYFWNNFDSGGGVAESIQYKFLEDIRSNQRFSVFDEVLSSGGVISYLGVGIGVPSFYGGYAHNLIIHGFHQMGLVGLVTALGVILTLSLVVIRGLILLPNRALGEYGIIVCSLASVGLSKYMLGVRGQLDSSTSLLLGISLGVLVLVDTKRRYQETRGALSP